MSDYKVTIGLEIHVALKTKSKLFSRSACDFELDKFSYFDAGIPGMLPVLSEEPVKMALKFATAVNSEIPDISIFERKHYFYPDLSLGYQITQQHNPIMIGGVVPIEVDGKSIEVQIEHAHLECDAAKSLHDKISGFTAIDLSRGSSPLLEIVSTPCLHSPKEAKTYAQTVCDIVKYLDICDGKLEEGSFRVDASISLSKTEKLGTRVEIKNISSFGYLETALNYEIERQTELLDSGIPVEMETRLFDEKTSSTMSMRKKETVHEYRYMPDPDIPPLVLDQDLKKSIIEDSFIYYFEIKKKLEDIFEKLNLKVETTAQLLTSKYKEIWKSLLSEKELQSESFIKMLAYWIPEVHSKSGIEAQISFDDILKFYKSGLQAKEMKEAMIKYITSDLDIDSCIPKMMDNTELEIIIKTVLSEYPSQIKDYKEGNEKLLQFIIGKSMAAAKGKAPATLVKEIVIKLIKDL
jgi:aspartyl-tRNA(Asn)/glutamyl-tRNA(Gln) amidotransferase subunit B